MIQLRLKHEELTIGNSQDMIKFKEKNKKDKELLITKLSSKDKINTGEIERLLGGKLEGFLPLVCEGKRTAKTLIYDKTNVVTLKNYLSKPQTKERFINVLQQISNVMRTCEEYGMSYEKLILDCDYVFVDYITEQLLFVYYPVETYEFEEITVKFIQQVSSYVNGSKNENIDFIIDFRKYSDSLKYFALVDFERKIESMSKGISEDEKKKPHKSHHYSGRMVFNPFDDVPKYDSQEDEKSNKCICPKCNIEYVLGTKYCAECGENLTPIRGNTETADKEIPLTSIPSKKNRQTKIMLKKENVVYPSLLRIYNNEEIEINKSEFLMGYDNDCDYSFQDNDLISGHHAKILLINENIYIIDSHSTNGTYINGKEIPYGKKMLLNYGDKITLADEEFVLRGND